MTQDQAVKVALSCIQSEVQRLAVLANLCDVYKAEQPAMVRASEQRKRLREAVRALENWQGRMV